MFSHSPALPIYLIDDEPNVLTGMKLTLRAANLTNVACFTDGQDALAAAEKNPASVVILDLLLPGLSGERVLRRLRRRFSEIPVVAVTAVHDIAKAVECIKIGAYDYLPKPVRPDELIQVTRKALSLSCDKQAPSRSTKNAAHGPDGFRGFVTRSDRMSKVFRYVEAAARTPFPALITGETGVGKEIIARAVHELSGRKGAFVTVNAAGVDDVFFADTLFGHVRGAFSGAEANRKGLLASADQGTIFLDEIGDLSPASQVKLLRLIQEKEYLPLGADRSKQVDTRIVSATCRDLSTLRRDGTFRQDLYYRLSTHNIHIPPLRHRPEDIPLLVDHFVTIGAKQLQVPKPIIPQAVMDELCRRSYPGNARELQALVFDALARRNGDVVQFEAALEAAAAGDGEAPSGLKELLLHTSAPLPTLKEARTHLIEAALQRSYGSISAAARLLGISPQALGQQLRRTDSP